MYSKFELWPCLCEILSSPTCTNSCVKLYSIYTQMFKDPLEQPQQRGGPIISHGDIKGIFANIPDILAVHQTLVVRGGGGCLGKRVCGGGGCNTVRACVCVGVCV